MAPCERLRTPETPKISVKPVAPSAYSALMAKPSIRICRVSMNNGHGSDAAPREELRKNHTCENAPGVGSREHDRNRTQFAVTLMKLGNLSFPFATSAGHTLTCLPSCHCSIRPVIRPLPYL